MKKLATLWLMAWPLTAMAQAVSIGGGSGLLTLIVWFAIVVILFSAAYWVLKSSAIGEPVKTWLFIVLGLFGLIFVINLLLSLIGHPFIRW